MCEFSFAVFNLFRVHTPAKVLKKSNRKEKNFPRKTKKKTKIAQRKLVVPILGWYRTKYTEKKFKLSKSMVRVHRDTEEYKIRMLRKIKVEDFYIGFENGKIVVVSNWTLNHEFLIFLTQSRPSWALFTFGSYISFWALLLNFHSKSIYRHVLSAPLYHCWRPLVPHQTGRCMMNNFRLYMTCDAGGAPKIEGTTIK